jgi:hypothetical protein
MTTHTKEREPATRTPTVDPQTGPPINNVDVVHDPPPLYGNEEYISDEIVGIPSARPVAAKVAAKTKSSE